MSRIYMGESQGATKCQIPAVRTKQGIVGAF